jgi:hypothetical protein
LYKKRQMSNGKATSKQLTFNFCELDAARNSILSDDFTIESLKDFEGLVLAQVTLKALNGDRFGIDQYMKYVAGFDETQDTKQETQIVVTKVIFENATAKDA